ncbi:putative gamma-glutamylcyclotransferase CG2811 isoform X1 [Penaeus chinensis]|uniref:putative gamma-glutamylcyclotransferase CG2811 isoform X1 n=1 Tax=Penaeus chinensis TaxID=139456 RepID=UPI001FB81286|nr:putative gamma-glutamylcyclotransferase CG2811 isoform X1 [Penaeus chinensis]
MATNLVFVYGTLKQNEPNHHWLTDKENGESKLVGKATTQERYPLVIASKFNIPFLLAVPGKGEQIEGEVYEVDEKMMSNLDILEDHPKLYERKKNKMTLEATGEVVECWIYLLHKYRPDLLDLPMLKSYSSKGSHGKEYVARYLREDFCKENMYDEMNVAVSPEGL